MSRPVEAAIKNPLSSLWKPKSKDVKEKKKLKKATSMESIERPIEEDTSIHTKRAQRNIF